MLMRVFTEEFMRKFMKVGEDPRLMALPMSFFRNKIVFIQSSAGIVSGHLFPLN
jgi:hypothetical protein